MESKRALQLLQHGVPIERTRQRSLRLLQQLNKSGFNVRFQRLPSHVGTPENEASRQVGPRSAFTRPLVESGGRRTGHFKLGYYRTFYAAVVFTLILSDQRKEKGTGMTAFLHPNEFGTNTRVLQ